jgi:hypothetical protein
VSRTARNAGARAAGGDALGSGAGAGPEGGRPGPRGAVAAEALGWVLLAGGAALMVLPGPGIPLVLAGLVLVGRRRPWARRWHEAARARAAEAIGRVRGRRPPEG